MTTANWEPLSDTLASENEPAANPSPKNDFAVHDFFFTPTGEDARSKIPDPSPASAYLISCQIFMNEERLRRSIWLSLLYQSFAEIELFTTKEGNTAVSAVLRRAQYSTNPFHLNYCIHRLTQAGRLCSSPKVQKLSLFGIKMKISQLKIRV